MSGTGIENPKSTYQDNPTGHISGFPVGSLLQVLELEQKTCTLKVRSNGKEGNLYIKGGCVLDAQTGTLSGEEAAVNIIGWENTRIQLGRECAVNKRGIHSSLTRLILDASRHKDEVLHSRRPPDRLTHAIQLLEGHHYKRAYAHILAHLKKYPTSSIAWLWFSRCLGRLETISKALIKCTELVPDNRQVAEEIKKLEQSRRYVRDRQVRRCPFCWSPLEKAAGWCHYCKARLSVSEALKANTLELVDSKFLIDAVTRYTDVIARENNIKATYYLSLANCNLDKVEEALDLLNEVSRANPANPFLSKQLDVVLNHVATRLTNYEGTAPQTVEKAGPWKLESSKNKKILVVEDSPTTRKVIKLTLKQKGYTLLEARDGLEALSLVNEERPDLVLLDIILPKMDGYQILSIIKRTPELGQIPVILLTNKDGLLNKVKARLAGSTAYLTKPFEPKELVDTVRKYMP